MGFISEMHAPFWHRDEGFFEKLEKGVCPSCDLPMEAGPRTILGGAAGPGLRHAYDNFECKKCGMRVSWLVKDPVPAGTA